MLIESHMLVQKFANVKVREKCQNVYTKTVLI
jgi:hypothetical protein